MQPLLVNPWYAGLSPSLRSALQAAGSTRRLAPGEWLFRQNDAPGDWYAVLSGAIKVSSVRIDGVEAILGVLEPGNWFGEISLLDGAPRTHDAAAVGETQVFCVPPQAFQALMRQAEFAAAIARLMAPRIRTLYGVIEDATLRSTRARVARRIELLARGDATQASEQRARLRVSQEALAMMLGLTRQTLSKELSQLAARGAIRLGYRSIEIVSPQALAAAWQEVPAVGTELANRR